MDRTMEWIRGHKAVFFGVLAAAMVAYALIISAVGSASARDEERQGTQQEEASREPVADEGDSGEGISGYQGSELEIVEAIAGSRWVSTDGRGYLEASPTKLTEILPSSGEEADEHEIAYTVSGVDDTAPGADQTGYMRVRDFIITDEAGEPHVAHLATVDPAAGESAVEGDPYYILTSSAFENAAGYTTDGAVDEIELQGTDDERLLDVLGTGQGALEDALSSYVMANHSTAYRCAWTGRASVDYAAGTAAAEFEVTSSEFESPRVIEIQRDLSTGAMTGGDVL